MSDDDRPKSETLGPKTKVTLATVGAVAVTLLAGWGWLSSRLDSTDRKIESTDRKIDAVGTKLSSIDESSKTIQLQLNSVVHEKDMRAWIRLWRAQDPKAKIPDFE